MLLARRVQAIISVAFVLTAGCSQVTIDSPTNPSPPAADISGRWTGTFESSNFTPRAITMTITQGGGCVDGTWTTNTPEWSGIISGTATTSSFASIITFEDASRRCQTSATLSGDAGGSTMTWRVQPFTPASTCAGLPRDVVVKLQRPSGERPRARHLRAPHVLPRRLLLARPF